MGVQEAGSRRGGSPRGSECEVEAQTIPNRMYVYVAFSSKNVFPIPGRDKITPISNISFVLFPPRPHLQSWFPKCHEERAVQKWVFIYPAPNTPNDALSTLKWGCGGLGFILHVFEMGVIKSRPGTFWHPDFLFAALVGHLSNVFSQRWHYWGDNFVDVLLTSIIFYARRFSSTRLPANLYYLLRSPFLINTVACKLWVNTTARGYKGPCVGT